MLRKYLALLRPLANKSEQKAIKSTPISFVALCSF